jgi:anti-sigma factor (TIGR02949 family)
MNAGGTINCTEAVRRLWDYLDASLSPEDSRRIDEHLAFCRRCCGEVEFAKELHAFLASQAVEDIPPDVRSRLERFVEEM